MNGGVQVEDVGDDAVRQESVWEGGPWGGESVESVVAL